MRTKEAILHTISLRRHIRFYIILTWVLGVFVGLHIIPRLFPASNCQLNLSVPLDHSPAWQTGFSLMLISATVISLYYRKQCILLLLCIFKSILFGFSLFLIGEAFGSGAWIAVILFLFTDVINICLLLWFWLKHRIYTSDHFFKDIAIYLVALSIAALFERIFLTPVVQKIF